MEVRTLTRCDIERHPLGRCLPIDIASLVDGSLDLHDGTPATGRNPGRKGQAGCASRSPAAILGQALAGFVPALYEVMLNVDSRRPRQLDESVVIVPFAFVPGRNHRM